MLRLLAVLLAGLAAAQSTSSSSSASTGTGTGSQTSPIIQTITTAIAPPSGTYIYYTNQITVSTNGAFSTYQTVSSRYNSLSASSASTASNSSSTSNSLLLQGTFRTMSASNSSATTTRASPTPTPSNTQRCNNYVEFCNRRYMNVTEVCAHNSAFTTPNNAARNQDVIILGQLNDGIRMIQGETHWVNNTIYSCHTNCNILNAGPLVDELTTVRQWVAAHPYDVVTILLVNSDFRNISDYVAPIQDSGLGPFLYTPPKIPMHRPDWPTYGDMILSGKRVVIFMDYNANQTEVPYVLDEFSQMWETPFSPTDPAFPCTQQRPPGLNADQQALVPYLANHNLNVQLNLGIADLLIPNFASINSVNANNQSNNSLLNMAQRCDQMWGRPPAWLLVDFYDKGNVPGSVFQVAAQMNNVTYNRTCCGQVTGVSGSGQVGVSSPMVMLLAVVVAWLAL